MSLLPSVGVHMLLVSVTICCLNANQAQAVLAGAAVLPHGDFVYDPSLVHNRNGSLELHNAAKRVGAWLQDLSVDVVFMTTPHGLADDTNFLLYRNTNGSGYALIGQDLHNASFPSYKVPLHASLAPNVTKALTHLLSSEHGQNVSGLTGFGDGDDMPLRWGEVIPLSFLEPHLNASHTQVAILSMPSRRYTQDALMYGPTQRELDRHREIKRLKKQRAALEDIHRKSREAQAKLAEERAAEKRRDEELVRGAKASVEERRRESVQLKEKIKQRREILAKKEQQRTKRLSEQEQIKKKVQREKQQVQQSLQAAQAQLKQEKLSTIQARKQEIEQQQAAAAEKERARRQAFQEQMAREREEQRQLRAAQEKADREEAERLEQVRQLRAKEAEMRRQYREKQKQEALERAKMEAAREQEMLAAQRKQAEEEARREAERQQQKREQEEARRQYEARLREKQRIKEEQAAKEREELARRIREQALAREREKERREQLEAEKQIEQERLRQERIVFRKSLIDFMEAEPSALFERADDDNTGEVTVKQMLDVFNKTKLHPFPRAKLLPLLGIIDEDGTFALTRDEFCQLVERMKTLKVAGKLL
ncbi:hypothetical protein PTSG_01592, partial [Salpingoeca rosetta]